MTDQLYKIYTITPHHAGFGMWDAGNPHDDEYLDYVDAFGDFEDYTLLEDGAKLPRNAEDIRGKVYNEPEKIFFVDFGNGYNQYIGVSKK